jgi:hypothetical protein
MVETTEFRQVLWLVMLKYVKDRILEVDTPGQHVVSRVRYRMACLLIRDDTESVTYSDEWEVVWSFTQAHMAQEGPWYRNYPGNLSIAIVPHTTIAKPSMRPIVNNCTSM